jgi:Ca2+-binding EF-hand superfamily protein
MAPKKSSTAAGRGAPDSHRGAKQDSQRGAKKKAGGGAAKKKSSLEAVSEGSVTTAQEEALLPLADLLAPAQAILDELAKELEAAIKEQGDVTEIIVPVVVEQTSAAEETKANEELLKKRKSALRIWTNFAAQRLAEMASSLEAALAADSKLKDLFNKIDVDLGGSIDEKELHEALVAAGKKVSPEFVHEMFRAADYDDGGDIDYSEFADVIKGVKASKAAFNLQRGVRRHQEAKLKKVLLTKDQLETRLAACLLQQSPKDMAAQWDRSRKRGSISQVEFRQGVRFRFALNFENKDLDDIFDRFDKDRDGFLSLSELKDMFRATANQQKEATQSTEQLEQRRRELEARIAGMQAEVAACTEALEAAASSEAAAKAHKGFVPLDARLGERLRGKIKSADNPKAVLSLDDVASQWDIGRHTEGFADLEEFGTLAASTLAPKPPPHAAEVQATFTALESSLSSGGGSPPTGKLPIKPLVQALLAAEKARIAEGIRLVDHCTACKARAREAQAKIQAVTAPPAPAPAPAGDMLDPVAAAAADTKAAPASASPSAAAPAAPAAGYDVSGGDDLLAKLATLDGTAAAAAARAAK